MIKTDLKMHLRYTAGDIVAALSSLFPLESNEVGEVRVLKQSLDLSDTHSPFYKLTVAFSLSEEREAGLLKYRNRVFPYSHPEYSAPIAHLDFRPVIVGSGPAGLFAALVLAEAGARPIVLERGLDVDGRMKKIKAFNLTGVLDPECNVQFGEGGAGAYSDGKLKVGSMNTIKMKILSELVAAGAEPSILFSNTGHVGTDKLVNIIKNVRCKAVAHGAEFVFGARFVAPVYKDSELAAVKYIKEGTEYSLPTRALILAIGHSARDTVRALYSGGMVLTPKSFGIGVRIEHPREYINRIVYKHAYGSIEESASYHLVTHLKSSRSVYSFCMCPGGTVVAATGSVGSVVTNGMSEHARNAENSNAAILVSVTPGDFGGDALLGMLLQEKIEGRAYSLTKNYRAPAQSLASLGARVAKMGEVAPSYPRGTECIDINEYMPEYIAPSIIAAMPDFDAWLPGYNLPDAVITGPETRTTSPVRMERDKSGVAIGKSGIFPAGEGAGYAGGIVSSAADGISQAENLIKYYQK